MQWTPALEGLIASWSRTWVEIFSHSGVSRQSAADKCFLAGALGRIQYISLYRSIYCRGESIEIFYLHLMSRIEKISHCKSRINFPHMQNGPSLINT